MSTHPNRDNLLLLKTSPLAQSVRDFLIDKAAAGCSPQTVETYRRELSGMVAFMSAIRVHAVEDMEATHLRRFILALGDTRNPGGVHIAYRTIKTFLRWFAREYEPEGWRNPVERVQPPRLAKEPLEPLSLSDLRGMLGTCRRKTFAGDRDRAILLALLDTGCRASEFLALDVGDLDLGSGALRVRRGKGNKGRVVFLGKVALREVSRYLRRLRDVGDGGPLWMTAKGARLSLNGLRSIVRRRAADAGVKPPSLHSFRRSFALLSLRGGMDVYSLQKLMGHSDLSVLRRYLALCEGDLRAAHAKSSPVDAL